MASVLERKLIVMTGKGGVGKTTLASAIGLLAARRGLRTIVVEVTGAGSDAGAAGRLAAMLGHAEPPEHGVEVELDERLWGLSIDRDRVVAEWLRALGGRVPARVLTSSASVQYLIAAAPGTREMTSLVKVWELAQGRRPAARARARGGVGEQATDLPPSEDYDLVVLDAPATGHALALLRAPQLFSAIARVGPIANQARQVRDLLENPALSAYIAVAHATEMSSTETLELRESLRDDLGQELHAVLVNGSLPRRFAGEELRRIAALHGRSIGPTTMAPTAAPTRVRHRARTANGAPPGLTLAATRAALSVHERARAQQSQIARLRRQGITVLTIPFSFQAELDLAAVQRIVDRLDREL
ncbi:MAG TPA: ArsA-related P-loop ATPase [Solirubrobacteraceae bacterium]